MVQRGHMIKMTDTCKHKQSKTNRGQEKLSLGFPAWASRVNRASPAEMLKRATSGKEGRQLVWVVNKTFKSRWLAWTWGSAETVPEPEVNRTQGDGMFSQSNPGVRREQSFEGHSHARGHRERQCTRQPENSEANAFESVRQEVCLDPGGEGGGQKWTKRRSMGQGLNFSGLVRRRRKSGRQMKGEEDESNCQKPKSSLA